MRMCKALHRRQNNNGQVLVEYLLMLVMAMSLVLIIQNSLRKSTFSLWKSFTCDVVAACPGCPYSPSNSNSTLRCAAR
jgi:hypothetical protein